MKFNNYFEPMKKNLWLLCLSVCLASTASAQDAEEKVIASVNGTKFTEVDFQAYTKSRLGVSPGASLPMDKRSQYMEEMINRELIYQAALNEGFDQTDAVQTLIYEQIRNIITTQRIEKLLAETPVTEEEMRKLYEQQLADSANREYHARHILLKSEEDANKIIAILDKGTDFVKLANETSSGSTPDGGDLGWFTPDQMVQPFSEAVEALKPGEYTKKAVQTRFGWHVIKLEESRDVAPPSYHSLQSKLAKMIQNQTIEDYINKLREDAIIDEN
ncbi:MAG: peptidylprolyl isomerase [Gammaproteobacteria bacterium]|nr:peptidylprolyl isomerase [Gammaproteobacteria bacterium]